jgi:hypothetical protein
LFARSATAAYDSVFPRGIDFTARATARSNGEGGREETMRKG